jgi:hypothetical protein
MEGHLVSDVGVQLIRQIHGFFQLINCFLYLPFYNILIIKLLDVLYYGLKTVKVVNKVFDLFRLIQLVLLYFQLITSYIKNRII